jgi:hypothetical protein
VRRAAGSRNTAHVKGLDVDSLTDIPEELRALKNWVVWRSEKRAAKSGAVRETKVPYCVKTGRRAKSNDPATWSAFGDATEALKRGYTGVGFCLTPPYVGVDLDGCCEGETHEPWADEIIGELDSYTELSPSRNGVHVIVKGELPDGPRQKDMDGDHHGIGLYDAARGRYLTVTGCRIRGNGTIAERTAELRRIHFRLFPAKADDELIERARKANDGGKFTRLWDGQWQRDYASPSEADIALCMKLIFWAGRDRGRVDALFRRSGLMREKWNRQDYRERTIEAALAKQKRTWKEWSPGAETVTLVRSAVEPTIDNLNGIPIFAGRIRFTSVSRRGSMILAMTADNRQIIWPTTNDLTVFARARTAIAEGTDVLLPQPPRDQVGRIWEPAADLLIRISALDALRVEHVLKDECRDLLILMWRYAKQPVAADSRQFMEYMLAISRAVRNREQPAPPCVFIAEGCCWVHVPTFRNWISLSSLTNRLYPLADIRQGLLLLGFEYQKDVTRGYEGDSAGASLWRGPIDVLAE